MQVTKGTWRMREQCVPGSLSSSPAQEPGNEASITCAFTKVLHALNVEYKLIQKLVVLLSTQCIYYLHTRCVINSLTAYM